MSSYQILQRRDLNLDLMIYMNVLPIELPDKNHI